MKVVLRLHRVDQLAKRQLNAREFVAQGGDDLGCFREFFGADIGLAVFELTLGAIEFAADLVENAFRRFRNAFACGGKRSGDNRFAFG